MEQRFADKLRDIADQVSEDDALIRKMNSMFDRYAPKLKEKLPEGVQKDLIKLAKQKQYRHGTTGMMLSDYDIKNYKLKVVGNINENKDLLNLT